MNYNDLAKAAFDASTQAEKENTPALHKSASAAHALARDASRELAKSTGQLDELQMGLVDDPQTSGHQSRHEWHDSRSAQLSKAGTDKPAEQVDVTAEGGSDDEPDESEAEAAKEEGSEANEGPPMAKNMDDYSDMNKGGLNAWLSDRGEDDILDLAAEDTFSKSYDDLVEKGEGEGTRGGNVVGHSASGKPIYEQAKQHAQQAANLSMRSQSLRGKAKKEMHAKMAEHHANASEAYTQAHKESGDSEHEEAANFQLRSAQHHSKKAGGSPLKKSEISKAGGPFIGVRGGKWADAAHKIPWNDKKHAGKNAPTAKKHDPEGARDLVLTTENDGDLHQQQHEPIRDNLARKMAAGKYDHAQATKLFTHLTTASSKKMSGGAPAHDVPTRQAAAKVMADQFHDEAMSGEHDDRVPKKHKGKSLKELHGPSMSKSFAGDGALGDWLSDPHNWLSKAVGPGTGNYGGGTAGKPLPKGVRGGLDERNGYTGNVGVSRGEDGGKLDGVGATSGKSDGGMANMQSTTKMTGAGKTDQFTPDDPNDTDKMKSKLGMISMPGAPAGAYGAQGAQRSAASQGGNAYGDATAPMPGAPSSAAASGSNPQTGAAGIGEKRSQGGPAYGSNHTGNQQSMRASTHDPQGGASGASPGAPSGSNPQTGAPGLHQNESSSKLFSKAEIDAQTGMPLHADQETISEQRSHAAAVSALRKGGDDIVMGLGVRESVGQEAPLQSQPVRVMMKGGIIMTDISDRACVALLKSSEDNFGYHGRQPGFDMGNDLTKSLACPACGTRVMKALTKCPACGVDRMGGSLQKGFTAEAQADIPQTHSKGPGLRRPVPGRDLLAPGGLTFDD